MPRCATPRTPDRPTLGPAVHAWSIALGAPLFRWQRRHVDTALEVNPDTGELVYGLVVMVLPRQQGKTTELMPVVWNRLDPLGALLTDTPWPFAAPEQALYLAQSLKDAKHKVLNDPYGFARTLTRAPRVVQRRTDRIRRADGDIGITWANGSRFDVVAPNEDAGRGRTRVGMVVLDEAYALADTTVADALSAVMVTARHQQLWVVSSPGTDASRYLADQLALGRAFAEAGRRDTVCVLEYGAGDDDDPADPATWARAMPSYGLTITEAAMRTRYEQAAATAGGLDGFAREWLGRWTRNEVTVVPLALWRELADDAPMTGTVAFAVEVDVDRTVATIVAAGRTPTGRTVVEVVDQAAGTDWVYGRLDELVARHDPVGIGRDSGGPAGALDLDDLGVVDLDTRALARACGWWHDQLLAPTARLAHRGDPRLEAAAGNTRRRPAGGTWLYDRRAAPNDASAWVAAVIAAELLRRELR